MAIKTWNTTFPTTIDDNTSMEAVVAYVDEADASQPNALRDAVIALETEVGAATPAGGSLRARVADLEVDKTSYLTTTVPTGAPAPTALYQFDGTASKYTDRTGNGHNVTLVAGTEVQPSWKGIVGSAFETAYLQSAAGIGALQSLGAITIEVQLMPYRLDNSSRNVFVWFGEAGALEADNILYSVHCTASGSSLLPNASRMLECRQEKDAGQLRSAIFANSSIIVWDRKLITYTREADGVTWKLYINGQLIDTQVLADAPTGGTTSRLFIGGDGSFFAKAIMHSVRITVGTTYDAAQVLEAYEALEV